MSDISPYFTNLDKPVFGLKLPPEIAAMLFSRYSRSTKPLRSLFAEEFLPLLERDSSAFNLGQQSQEKTQQFFDRVLVGYGDDSVSQLGGAHIAMEGISQIAELFFTDARIGVAPLVKSTRYVRFDQKNEKGEYGYYTPASLPEHLLTQYKHVMDLLFNTYAAQIDPVRHWLTTQIPFESMELRHPQTGDVRLGKEWGEEKWAYSAYQSSIRAKACDILRAYLPASTLTNMGIFASGQAWEHLIRKGLSLFSIEIPDLVLSVKEELQQLIPSFVKRAVPSQYLSETQRNLDLFLTNGWQEYADDMSPVQLVEYNINHDFYVLQAIVFSYGKQIPNDRETLLKTYIGERKSRRDKPGRALEHAEYTFRFLGNLGIYRDLHRHRILTQNRQPISAAYGYDTPQELVDMGYQQIFQNCMEQAKDLYTRIAALSPTTAQYCVPFAYKQKWYMKMNLREALHICELRSMPQGHPDYRKIAQQIWRQITAAHPLFQHIINFVDFNDYSLGRMNAEAKEHVKSFH